MSATIHSLASGAVSRPVAAALNAMDAALVAAIETAKNASVPQGLIVAILHGHANRETNIMMNGGD